MNFFEYCNIIANSVAETGYNAFSPSLCAIEGDEIVMKVLDGELSVGGDEQLARQWAEGFARKTSTVFLAYRQGQRTITVLELLENTPVRRRKIIVDPHIPEETIL